MLKISIVIPVFNGEETISLCLDAVVNLSLTDDVLYEILVINDGSTDSTQKILDSYENIDNLSIFNFDSNSGRLVAREIGAQKSKYENILFIDSRIIVSKDILLKLKDIDYSPIMAGDLGEDKYNSDYDTLFYLIRKKIYKPYYPQDENLKELWIDKKNFLSSPKGTGCFLIEKELFLKSLPDSKDKETSDDTKIMKNIVFKLNKKLLRHYDVKIKYLQRQDTGNIYGWINHRGKLWADYYLTFFNKYSVIYYVFSILMILFLLFKTYLFVILGLLSIVAVSGYLAENKKDFKLIITLLPNLLLRFYLGTIQKQFSKISFKNKNN